MNRKSVIQIKKISLVCLLLLLITPVFGQAPPKPYGALPALRQLRWQATDMYCIIHFSMNTYTDKEWGYGDEDPEIFKAFYLWGNEVIWSK